MKVDVVFGIEIDGIKLALDEEAARSLYSKLKEFFDKNNSSYIPYYPITTFPSIPWNPNWVTTTSGTIPPITSQETDTNVHFVTGKWK